MISLDFELFITIIFWVVISVSMLKNMDMVWWSVLLAMVWELYFTLNQLYIITVSDLLISVFCLPDYFIGLGRIKPLELNILYHWLNIGTLRGLFILVKNLVMINLMLVPTSSNLVTRFFRWSNYTIISLIFLAIRSNLWTRLLVSFIDSFWFFIFSWLCCWCFRCYFLKCWQVVWLTPHCVLSSKAFLSWWLLKLISIVVEFILLCEGIFILYSNL